MNFEHGIDRRIALEDRRLFNVVQGERGNEQQKQERIETVFQALVRPFLLRDRRRRVVEVQNRQPMIHAPNSWNTGRKLSAMKNRMPTISAALLPRRIGLRIMPILPQEMGARDRRTPTEKRFFAADHESVLLKHSFLFYPPIVANSPLCVLRFRTHFVQKLR